MAEIRRYRILENRFRKSFMQGFEQSGEDSITCTENEYRHFFACEALDGVTDEAEWGRICYNYDFSEETVVTVYVFASDERGFERVLFNPEMQPVEKRAIMEENDVKKVVNKKDFLLTDIRGRFLYIVFDVMGTDKGSISGINVYTRADILIDSFPEVYREDNEFFNRFLSIFSSLYVDFQTKINHVDELLDIDACPKELLPIYAHWMGIDVSGDFLQEDRLRLLVKEAYNLNRMKGTKEALERLTEIILGEKAIVLEKNVFRDQVPIDDKKIYESLYGNKPYDVTMLISTYVQESQKSQLLFLLNQFKPIRCRLMIKFLNGSGEIDSHTYLDMNAEVYGYQEATLDSRHDTDGLILLGE